MSLLRLLLAMLLAFLRPAAVESGSEEGEAEDPAGDLDTGDEGAGDEGGEDAGDGGDDEGAGDEQPNKGARPSENETRLQRENENYQRELAEIRARQAPPPAGDKQVEEWQRIANDPTKSETERWYANTSLSVRRTENFAATSLAQSADISDKTAFSSITLSDPTAKKYTARVEDELVKMRKNGQNASREAIYTFLLGKDMREGKFQKKKPSAARDNANENERQRGRLPNVRSDVRRGGTAMTNKEKLEKRLENVQI